MLYSLIIDIKKPHLTMRSLFLNKSKINSLEDDLNKAIKRLSALEEGVTQKS